MLDHVDHIYLATPDARDVSILGVLPSEDVREGLADMRQHRPAARRTDKGFAASVPLAGGAWCIWLLAVVPPVTELPRLLTRMAELSRSFAPPPLAPPPALAVLEPALADLPPRRRRNGKVLSARLSAWLVERTGCAAVMVIPVRQGRVLGGWPSDDKLARIAGQLRALMAAHAAPHTPPRLIVAASTDPSDLEATVLLGNLAAQRLLIVPPPQEAGYGLILLDPRADAATDPALAVAASVLQYSRPLTVAPAVSQGRKALVAVAAAALLLWLAWPAPTWLTVTGQSVPDETVTIALPSDATLQRMSVRVGMQVKAGDPVAQLFSAQLEERRAQEKLSIKVEELSAQSAMAQNDYGAFQLAEQRRQIAATRLQQIEARIADLTVAAPASGLVVAALPDSNTGAALPTGTQLAQVQTRPAFLVRLNPARVDARLLVPGQTGKIYFRGLADTTYDLTLVTPPVDTPDPATGSAKLEAFARITSADDGRLMGGLAGYARIAGPQQMRALSLGRYVGEFFRIKAWTYLGLPL